MKHHKLALSLLALSSPLLATQSPVTQIDISSGPFGVSSAPIGFGFDGLPSGSESLPVLAGEAYFLARDQEGGYRFLYKTDGTQAGTQYVSDMAFDPTPIPPPYWASSGGYNAAVMGGRMFLAGSDGSVGIEPIVVQAGTSQTSVLKDLNPGSKSSSPQDFTALGSQVFFVATKKGLGRELAVSDGTPGGTRLLDIFPGSKSSGIHSLFPDPVSGLLYFAANGSGQQGSELWVSNGTITGTHLLVDIAPLNGKSSNPTDFVRLGSKILFQATKGPSGPELWATDGTAAGTALVADLVPGKLGSWPHLTEAGLHNGLLYFTALDVNNKSALWVTDGTTAGTQPVPFASPASSEALPEPFGSIGGKLLVTASPVASIGRELYEVTPSGLSLLIDLAPGLSTMGYELSSGHSASPEDPLAFQGKLFFRAWSSQGRPGLYSTDGSAAGTLLVDQSTGIYEPFTNLVVPDWLTVLSPTQLLYRSSKSALGTELFVTDGTPLAIPTPVETLPQTHPGDVPFWEAACANGSDLMFQPVSAGPARILRLDAERGLIDLAPQDGLNFGLRVDWLGTRQVITFVEHNGLPRSVWNTLAVTDGSAASTEQLLDLPPGLKQPRVIGSNGLGLFLVGGNTATGEEPWYTDGTTAGTHTLGDLVPGPANSWASGGPTNADGRFFFRTQDGSSASLWSSDGTAARTTQLASFPGTATINVGFLGTLGDKVLFEADDGIHGYELWVSDGTIQATKLVADLTPGLAASPLLAWAVFEGQLYFVLGTSSLGQLWRTDGTATGTQLVPGIAFDDTQNVELLAIGDKLYCLATEPATGTELWSYDGQVAQRVSDLAPGPADSYAHDLIAVGARVYFGAMTAATGDELFAYDPATGLTSLVADLLPGPDGSLLSQPLLCGNALFVLGRTPEGVRNLYQIELTAAHTLDLGFGSGGPQLEVSAPILGQVINATIDATPPGTYGVLLLSAAIPTPLGGLTAEGSALWIDPSSFSILASSGATHWTRSFAIPSTPGLAGLAANVQVLFLEPGLGKPKATGGQQLVFGD